MTTHINVNSTNGYYRHGEAFWRDLIARQPQSGQGVRKFCSANGVAYSTFHKWRAALADRGEIVEPLTVTTADAMFIPILAASSAPTKPSSSMPEPFHPSPKSSSRDSVVLTSGGVRVELNGSHADRVVRHLLGRLGATC